LDKKTNYADECEKVLPVHAQFAAPRVDGIKMEAKSPEMKMQNRARHKDTLEGLV